MGIEEEAAVIISPETSILGGERKGEGCWLGHAMMAKGCVCMSRRGEAKPTTVALFGRLHNGSWKGSVHIELSNVIEVKAFSASMGVFFLFYICGLEIDISWNRKYFSTRIRIPKSIPNCEYSFVTIFCWNFFVVQWFINLSLCNRPANSDFPSSCPGGIVVSFFPPSIKPPPPSLAIGLHQFSCRGVGCTYIDPIERASTLFPIISIEPPPISFPAAIVLSVLSFCLYLSFPPCSQPCNPPVMQNTCR